MPIKKIIIADDHVIFREGLKQVIATTQTMQVTDEAGTGQELLRKVQEKDYDLVILDTPPFLAVTDATIVGRQSGTNLIVARFEVNSVREVELTMRRYQQSGIELKGAIFNGIEKRSSAKYGYGAYSYYNYDYKSDSV